MIRFRRRARVNMKALVIFLIVSFVICGGLVGAYVARRHLKMSNSLAMAEAAVARQDWREASKQLSEYLSRRGDDLDRIIQLAEARLSIEPPDMNQIRSGIGAYRKALQLSPGDADICNRLAGLYFRVGDFDEAIHVARQRLEYESQDASASLWLAKGLVQKRKYSEAEPILTDLVDRQAAEPDAFSLLCRIELEKDDEKSVERGLNWLNQSIERHPQSPRAFAQRGRFHLIAKGDPAAALHDLESAARLVPRDPNVLLVMTEDYMELGAFDRGEEMVNQLEQLTREELKTYGAEPADVALGRALARGYLAMHQGQTDQPAIEAQKGLDELKGERRTEFLPLATELYLTSGDTAKAREVLDEFREAALKADPRGEWSGDQLAYLTASVVLAEGRAFKAIGLLRPVIRKNPQYVDAWYLLASAYQQSGQRLRSLEALEQYVTRRADDSGAAYRVAVGYRSVDWEKVLRYSDTALTADSDHLKSRFLSIEARLHLAGRGASSLRAYDRIEEELAELVELHPKEPDVRGLQAELAIRRGENERAVAILEQGLSDCDGPEALGARLVDLLIQTGRREEAKSRSVQLVRSYPDSVALRNANARALSGSGDEKGALAEWSRAAEMATGSQRCHALIALARRTYESGSKEEGIRVLREAASEFQSDLSPRRLLLTLPEIIKDEVQAQEFVDQIKAIEEDGGTRWKLEQAKLWLTRDNWRQHQNEIESMLKSCLDDDPNWVSAAVALGHLYERKNQFANAEQLYRDIIERQPPGFEVIADQLLYLLDLTDRPREAQELLARLPGGFDQLRTHRINFAVSEGDIGRAFDELSIRVSMDPEDAISRLQLARVIYLRDGDVDGSLHLLDEAADIDSDLSRIATVRAGILHAEGRDDEAVSFLNNEVESRQDFTSIQNRAMFFAALGRLSAAEEDYRRLTEFSGREATAYLLLGSFYFETGQLGQAIESWDRGSQFAPEHQDLKRRLVQALVVSQEPKHQTRGAQLLAELLEEAPDDPKLLAAKAQTILDSSGKDFDRNAAAALEELVRLDPRNVGAYIRLIQWHRNKGEAAKAKEVATQALGVNPDQPDLLLMRAALEMDGGNRRMAETLGESVAEQFPEHIGAKSFLTNLALAGHQLDQAERRNNEILSLVPDHQQAIITKARILALQNKPSDAIDFLTSYVTTEKGKQSIEASALLASLALSTGDSESAEHWLAKARSMAPSDPEVVAISLRRCGADGTFGEAKGIIEDAIANAGDDVDGIVRSIGVLEAEGSRESLQAAAEAYGAVTKVNPDHIEAHLGAARSAYALGDFESAEKEYRYVLALEDTRLEAVNNLAWLLASDRGEPAAARELAEGGIDAHPSDPHLRHTLAFIHEKLGNRDDAERALERCIRDAHGKPGTKAAAMVDLMRIRLALNKQDDARELLRQFDSDVSLQKALNAERRAELEKLRESLHD